MNGPINRLLLGPIVGHTNAHSTRIWIQVRDNPEWYVLRVAGRGSFPFFSTESGDLEFGTAMAIADGLRPERQYRYEVLRRGHVVPAARGTFRTMPQPGSFADALFVSVSCSDRETEGAWPLLEKYIQEAKPRFLLMMGDQVYLDGEPSSLWLPAKFKDREARRQAMAERYRQHWRREPLRRVMANIPTYMMWDDHDIRDGWGSWASDSPTLQQRYPRGAQIAKDYNDYFEDARKVYWHFQMCHNLESPVPEPFVFGGRLAVPVIFQCGRLIVLMLDVRGDRDLWRETGDQVLGHAQWALIEEFVKTLSPNVDALAVVTSTPIVALSPDGVSMRLLGTRNDDVTLFSQGDGQGLLELQDKGTSLKEGAKLLLDLPRLLLFPGLPPFSDLKLQSFDEIRDDWSHPLSRPERERLISEMVEARTTNRITTEPRDVVFIGGDLHAGALFDIYVSRPEFTLECLVTSGISKKRSAFVNFWTFDEDFEVAEGIRARLQYVANDYNFGVTHILFNAGTPTINNSVIHAGADSYRTLKLPLP